MSGTPGEIDPHLQYRTAVTDSHSSCSRKARLDERVGRIQEKMG